MTTIQEDALNLQEDVMALPHHKYFVLDRPSVSVAKAEKLRLFAASKLYPNLIEKLASPTTTQAVTGKRGSKSKYSSKEKETERMDTETVQIKKLLRELEELDDNDLDSKAEQLDVDELKKKITELKQKKTEYFSMFKKLINDAEKRKEILKEKETLVSQKAAAVSNAAESAANRSGATSPALASSTASNLKRSASDLSLPHEVKAKFDVLGPLPERRESKSVSPVMMAASPVLANANAPPPSLLAAADGGDRPSSPRQYPQGHGPQQHRPYPPESMGRYYGASGYPPDYRAYPGQAEHYGPGYRPDYRQDYRPPVSGPPADYRPPPAPGHGRDEYGPSYRPRPPYYQARPGYRPYPPGPSYGPPPPSRAYDYYGGYHGGGPGYRRPPPQASREYGGVGPRSHTVEGYPSSGREGPHRDYQPQNQGRNLHVETQGNPKTASSAPTTAGNDSRYQTPVSPFHHHHTGRDYPPLPHGPRDSYTHYGYPREGPYHVLDRESGRDSRGPPEFNRESRGHSRFEKSSTAPHGSFSNNPNGSVIFLFGLSYFLIFYLPVFFAEWYVTSIFTRLKDSSLAQILKESTADVNDVLELRWKRNEIFTNSFDNVVSTINQDSGVSGLRYTLLQLQPEAQVPKVDDHDDMIKLTNNDRVDYFFQWLYGFLFKPSKDFVLSSWSSVVSKFNQPCFCFEEEGAKRKGFVVSNGSSEFHEQRNVYTSLYNGLTDYLVQKQLQNHGGHTLIMLNTPSLCRMIDQAATIRFDEPSVNSLYQLSNDNGKLVLLGLQRKSATENTTVDPISEFTESLTSLNETSMINWNITSVLKRFTLMTVKVDSVKKEDAEFLHDFFDMLSTVETTAFGYYKRFYKLAKVSFYKYALEPLVGIYVPDQPEECNISCSDKIVELLSSRQEGNWIIEKYEKEAADSGLIDYDGFFIIARKPGGDHKNDNYRKAQDNKNNLDTGFKFWWF